jgi:hypothetical protein
MKYFSIITLLLVCSAVVWFSCEKDIATQLEFSHYEYSGSDAGGGGWKPILLNSADQIGIPVPQSTNSASYQAELADVKAASSQLSSQQRAAVEYWGNNGLVRWNEIARELAAKYNLPPAPNPDGTYGAPDPANPGRYPLFPFAHPPYACRMFAYWSTAQMDALIAAWHYKYLHNRPAPYRVDNTIQTHLPQSDLPSYPSDAAVVAAVSEAILGAMFPLEKAYLNQRSVEHKNTALWSGANVWSDVTAGDSLGRAVAALFLARAAGDGMKNAQAPKAVSDSLANAAQLNRGTRWENQEDPQRPVGITPLFGRVRLWCVPNVELVRPPQPPAIGSPEFEQNVAELKQIAKDLTPEQRRIANFWSDGIGTYTPPGHWNRRATDLIVKNRYNPLRTSRTYAYMNMAIMDAGISCWDAKYYYHYPRPIQTIPGFKTILGTPNFPAYTSGHSTFSAAAATVLGHIFPSDKQSLDAWAEEAALSRLYGGIHYRFDSEEGLQQGRAVAAYSVAVARVDGAE